MLASRVRVSPCSDRDTRSSFGKATSIAPPSPSATVMGSATVWVRVPLGPFTVTRRPSMLTSTPDGTGTGSLPMRDMLLLSRLPDVGEDFPAYTLLVGLPVGQQAGRRRDDRDAEASQHPGQVRGLGVDAQTGLAHPAHAGDRTLSVGTELEVDGERLAHLGVLDLPAGDVALGLQDLGDPRLQLAVRHGDDVVIRRVGVPEPRQHVRDRVCHGHWARLPFLTVVSAFPVEGTGPAAL